MEPGKPCRVCGYKPATAPASAGTAAPDAVKPVASGAAPVEKPKMAKKARIGVLIGLLVVIVAALLVVKLVSSTGEPASTPVAAEPAAVQPVTPTSTTPPAATPAATDPAASTAAPGTAPAAAAGTAVTAAPATTPAAQPAATTQPPAATPAAKPADVTFVGTTDLPAYDITKREPRPTFTSKETFISWYLAHTDQKEKYLSQRWDRMQVILSQGHVKNLKTVDAFLATPRELFSRDLNRAYDDAALPIGYGQTISGPHLVAHMTDYLSVQPEHKVLEIGTGSGYQSAVLSQLSNHVYTIEIVKELAASTDLIYRGLVDRYPEYRNVRRKMADGYYGWKEFAPFDRIIVTCGIDHIPPSLLEQMAPEGIMLIPVGPPSGQTVLRIVKHVAADGSVTLDREDIYQGRHKPIFVPFTGGGSGKGNQ